MGHAIWDREEFHIGSISSPTGLVFDVGVRLVEDQLWKGLGVLISGIDVSNHQGNINWSRVAGAGYKFAVIKASEGTHFTDVYFDSNWQGSKAASLVRGAYHYARFSNAPKHDAENFLNVVKPKLNLGDFLALDVEREGNEAFDDSNLSDWCLDWLWEVELTTGVKPFLYSYPYFLAKHGLTSNPELSKYPLWLAAWQNYLPVVPPDWSNITIWQYSARGSVSGVSGSCDLNYLLLPRVEDLSNLGYGAKNPDEILELAWLASMECLGQKRFAGVLRRGDWGGNIASEYPVLVCDAGVLIVVDGKAVNVTARAIDDFLTLNESTGTLVRY